MIYNDNAHEIKWVGPSDKVHTVKIVNGEEELDIDDILKAAKQVIKDKQEMCENISYLGIGLTGDVRMGYGFLLGWLFRSVKQALETDSKWQITHSTEDISEEQSIDITIKTLDYIKTQLSERKMSLKDLPSLGGNNTNGPTDMF